MFQGFTVMNTVAMNILFQAFLWTYVFILDIYLGLELLGYKVYFHKKVPNHFPEWMSSQHDILDSFVLEDQQRLSSPLSI